MNLPNPPISASTGSHAIVIGAGMGGLAAAAALAGSFERVTVLERDVLRPDPVPRAGAPQSTQVHGLLGGGLRALCALLPGFERDLALAGATRIRMGLDDCVEIPGCEPFPRRDLGMAAYTLTRPLLELTLRGRVRRLPNVTMRGESRVLEIVAGDDGAVVGVRCRGAGGAEQVLSADLVIDASARGLLTAALLEATGWPEVERTVIGIDLHYVSTTFEIPQGRRDWKIVLMFPEGQSDTRAGFLLPVEGNRWMVAIGERHAPPPAPDEASFRELRARAQDADDPRGDRVGPAGRQDRSLRAAGELAAALRAAGRLPARAAADRRRDLPLQPDLWPGHERGREGGLDPARPAARAARGAGSARRPRRGLHRRGAAGDRGGLGDVGGAGFRPSADAAACGRRGSRRSCRGRSRSTGSRCAIAEVHRRLTAVHHLIEPPSVLQAPDFMRRVELAMAA